MNDKQSEALLEILSGLYIQSLRVYDVLCIIADKVDAKIIELKDLHEQGYVLAPDPALRIDDSKTSGNN
jgi:hypothetical protein